MLIIMRLVMTILLTRDISSLFNMFYWEFNDYEQYPKGVINTYGWDTPKVWYLVMSGISYQWSGFEDYQSSTINHLFRPFLLLLLRTNALKAGWFMTIISMLMLNLTMKRAHLSRVFSLIYANSVSDIEAMLVTTFVAMVHRSVIKLTL